MNYYAAARNPFTGRFDLPDEQQDLEWQNEFGQTSLSELRGQFRYAATVYGPFQPKVAPVWQSAGEIVWTDTKCPRIGDADDSTPICTPFPVARIVERRRFAKAEADYLAHADDETGLTASPEEIARQKMDRETVLGQSHLLAKMLESAGVPAYRNDAISLWVYWVHSQHVEKIPGFRRLCLLPYVAAMVRASKVAALEYFISQNPFCRFWTFTSGERVGIDQLNERCRFLHKRLNRLNAMLRARFGVELVFRSTEFGTLEFDAAGNNRGKNAGEIDFDPATGEPLFHVHAHCVVQSLVGYIQPAKWERMFQEIWDFWGFNWDGGQAGKSGVIRNARECCKYVTKPADMLKLTPEQLKRTAAAVQGLRLCAPLGQLRREIRARKEAGKCLRRYQTPDGYVWREVLDQNRHAAQDAADSAAINEINEAKAFVIETHAAAQCEPGETPRRVERGADFCAVFARLSPAIGPRGIKEARVIFGGTRCDLAAVRNHPLVFRLWSQTVESWEAGLALVELPLISVHTGTPTDADHPPPDPANAAELGRLAESFA